jgi:DNA-binding NarL/FixJ family response regulator
MKTIRIAITDDHPMVITGLRNMLLQYPEMEVIATYGDGDELLKGLALNQPDVLLLDICMPGQTGNDLARTISRDYPDIKMLALTSMDSSYHVKDMLDHGCLGYLLKKTDQQTLADAINEVFAGNQFIDPSLREQMHEAMLNRRKAGGLPSLTRREKEILQYVASGLTNQEIADKLFLSLRTVKNHRFNLLQKLDVKNTAELVTLAMKAGLI